MFGIEILEVLQDFTYKLKQTNDGEDDTMDPCASFDDDKL